MCDPATVRMQTLHLLVVSSSFDRISLESILQPSIMLLALLGRTHVLPLQYDMTPERSIPTRTLESIFQNRIHSLSGE
jgi:hypothetical protein